MYFLKIENLVIYMDLVEYSIDLNMVTPTGIEVELINFKFYNKLSIITINSLPLTSGREKK